MDALDEYGEEGFLAVMELIEEKVARQEQELFGDSEDLPEDESLIVWNKSLTHEEKVTQLEVLRAAKRVKPKSFSKRMTRAGRIHAQALGIRLD